MHESDIRADDRKANIDECPCVIEASSLQGIGVKDAFVCIADAVLENYLLSIEENNETGSVENSDYGYDQRLNGDIQDDEDIDADIDGSEAVFSNPFDDHEPDDDPEEESVIKPVDEDIDVDVAEIYDVINDSRDAEEEDQGAGKANRSHDENDAMQNGHQTKPSPKIVPRGMRGLNIEDGKMEGGFVAGRGDRPQSLSRPRLIRGCAVVCVGQSIRLSMNYVIGQ